MSELTAELVTAALATRPTILPDGRVQCQLCDRVVDTRQALGPHQLSHRRAVGLAPPRRLSQRGGDRPMKPMKRGVKQCPRCPAMIRGDNLVRHLKQIHQIPHRLATTEAVAAVVVNRGQLVVHEAPEPPPTSPLSDIAAVEAVTGILSAARTDGVIPVRLLPSAYHLVTHVEEVLAELRRLSE